MAAIAPKALRRPSGRHPQTLALAKAGAAKAGSAAVAAVLAAADLGGGRFGGVLQLSAYHTIRFEDQVLIREGLPPLDFLNGSAAGNRGGRPRHEVEVQTGITRRGLGARLTANWQSGTTVRNVGGGGDLDFSDVATFNLRLFADLGAQRRLVEEVPFLRGARVSLHIDNLFDSRPQVTDAFGLTPLAYRGPYLDPLGRSVRISFRKQFLPSFGRRPFARGEPGGERPDRRPD